MARVALPSLVVFVALASGCGPGGGTYCQTGSKYGTQCYSQMDVQNPPGQRPEPPPDLNKEKK